MRRDVSEWERPGEHTLDLPVTDIERFAPSTWSFMEFKTRRDLELVDRIYSDHRLLGEFVSKHEGRFQLEFMMNTHDRLFRRRAWLEGKLLLAPDDDTRDPRVRARLRVAGYVPLYEGKSFWIHNPYFSGAQSRDSVSKFVELTDIERELTQESWQEPRLVFRDIAASTNQRTLVPSLMPPAVHANTAPSLEGGFNKAQLLAILGSLTLDYIIRMKISTHLNWHYMETLPVAVWDETAEMGATADELVSRLNTIGAEFGEASDKGLIAGADRLAARLLLDSLVASLYGLHPDELRDIATQFPIYDKEAPPDLRYPELALAVYQAMYSDGTDAATFQATKLVERRAAAGCGFGLDELWQPERGWAEANREARVILENAGVS